MPEKFDNIEEKMNSLVQKFISKLPGRIAPIEELVHKINKEGLNPEDLDKLRLLTHSLKGTSGSYGLEPISKISHNIESWCKNMKDREGIPEKDQKDYLLSQIEQLHSHINSPSAHEEPGELHEIPATPQKEMVDRVVFVVEPDFHISNELKVQFQLYGYNPQIISNLQAVKDFIAQFNDDHEDLNNEYIMVIDTLFLERMPEEIEKLKNLLEKRRINLTLAFISEQDHFNLRLKAVRAGADAFFVLPLDVSQLIEKLDKINSHETTDPFHILIVDDDPEQVAWCAYVLQQKNMITSVVSNPMQVISEIIESKPELILMDLNMPECNGMELAKVIRQQEAFVSIPIVFLSGEQNSEVQFKALRYGGDDFLTKPIQPDHLTASVMIRAERYRKLRYYMERDSLTGLLNHTRVKEQLYAETLRASRGRAPISFAMIDLDYFKKVNDTYGHLIGDKVLKGLAYLLKERLRKSDIIGRYGGEEFAIIFPNTDGENAYKVLNEIRESFGKMKHRAEDKSFFVTLSGGIATFPEYDNPLKVSEMADRALYRAKETGRNQIILDSPREQEEE